MGPLSDADLHRSNPAQLPISLLRFFVHLGTQVTCKESLVGLVTAVETTPWTRSFRLSALSFIKNFSSREALHDEFMLDAYPFMA